MAGAVEAFQLAAASGDTRHSVPAALHLWILQSEVGDSRAVDEAYLLAVDVLAQKRAYEDMPVAQKSLGLGTHIACYQREFVQSARRALHRSVNSEDPVSVSLAAMGLAGLEMQDLEVTYGYADVSAAKAVIKRSLLRVIDSGLPDYVVVAAKWLASISEQTGDVDLARIALRAAMDSGNSEDACHAVSRVGRLFKREGQTEEAITAMRFVVENSQTGLARLASEDLGDLLTAQGDTEGARAAYHRARERER
ncbi:tetratricopeptide repeat protein [Nonomuraea typhae]|uniref:Tetratricopeptide repeat protein n=1 Tax=Nonomuraea typhae TaxID=2603600 RepID=A0ABW7Z7A2_9ACTN